MSFGIAVTASIAEVKGTGTLERVEIVGYAVVGDGHYSLIPPLV
jgi:hypothetical protein